MTARNSVIARLAIIGGAIALSSVALPAMAQSPTAAKPMGKMTCSDYLKIEEIAKPKYVYFATAYASGGKPEDAVIDIVYIDQLVPVIAEDCQRNLNASYYARVREQYMKGRKSENKK